MTSPDAPYGPRRRPSAGEDGRRPAKSRARWGLRLAACTSAILLTAAGAGHAVVGGLEAAIDRIDPFSGLDQRPRQSAGDGQNFLVVGTDGREGITPEQRERYHLGGAPCHCTDTIMLVHLSADRQRASVVSIPRDSYAELPAGGAGNHGRPSAPRPLKINAAYAQGGPGLTVRAVEHMTGVHVDHYLEVDFTSFMNTVDVLGGVDICTPSPLRDSHSGLRLPAGTSRLDGGEALQYVRSRQVDGEGDMGRMERQQRFLAALVDRAGESGVLLNPVKFEKVASTLLGSVRADRGFGSEQMLGLGKAMRGFTPSAAEFTSVPVADPSYQVPGLGSTVKWDRERAGDLFDAIRADRPLPRNHGPRSSAPGDGAHGPEVVRGDEAVCD
ncbi:LCP family protein [Streptomyces lycii]|uniref:LCP family protein n=1 Tax=Streptomyces lycii TaxID=2654337 RepID=A0ABQ7FBN2_9ACTN|nr:LCP family protein [Streptomyces lycii]